MKKIRLILVWLLLVAANPVLVSCDDADDSSEAVPNNSIEQTDARNKAPYGAVPVDLGLPSGTKWANMNIGATKPEEYGDYFRWGETTPFKEGDTYKSYSYKSTDLGESIAGTQYDAATMNWGTSWKMPTLEQIQELTDNCTYTLMTLDGVDGAIFIGPNGASIFFPTAGYRHYDDGTLGSVGGYGGCWSATPNGGTRGSYLYFGLDGWFLINTNRTLGFPVRAVAE
ncbi:MAG: hypothetical protein IJ841_04910 [Prevotella sp.]|nr:hypothetical protein [Prevotella sp.]